MSRAEALRRLKYQAPPPSSAAAAAAGGAGVARAAGAGESWFDDEGRLVRAVGRSLAGGGSDRGDGERGGLGGAAGAVGRTIDAVRDPRTRDPFLE